MIQKTWNNQNPVRHFYLPFNCTANQTQSGRKWGTMIVLLSCRQTENSFRNSKFSILFKQVKNVEVYEPKLFKSNILSAAGVQKFKMQLILDRNWSHYSFLLDALDIWSVVWLVTPWPFLYAKKMVVNLDTVKSCNLGCGNFCSAVSYDSHIH